MPVFDVDQWLSSLKEKYNIPEDDLKAAAEIKAGFLRQDEWSRREDARRKKEQEIMQKERETQAYHEQLQAWYEANEQALRAAADMQQRGSNPADRQVYEEAMSRVEELEEKLQRLGESAVNLSLFISDKSFDYYERFKKRFPGREFEKFVNETRIPDLDIAYEKFIAEDMAKIDAKKREEELKAAREEGAREALSRVNVPVDTAPNSVGLYFARREQSDSAMPSKSEQASAFASAWQEALNKTNK